MTCGYWRKPIWKAQFDDYWNTNDLDWEKSQNCWHITSSYFCSSSWTGPEFRTAKNRWPVNSQNALGKLLLVNVKNFTYRIYVAEFRVQYCISFFISCSLHISGASPNDWILELNSSTKTVIRQVLLGLPLLPILSRAHLKLESGIESCILSMFSSTSLTEHWRLILYTWKPSRQIYLSSCFDLSSGQYDEATKIDFVYQYTVTS